MFPLKNKELTKRWEINMRRDKWHPTAYSYICSSHFEDRFMYVANDRRRLLANAIPTIFSFPDHLQKPKTIAIKVPRKRSILEESASFEPNLSSNQPAETENHGLQTDHSYCLPSPKKIKRNCDALQERNEKLRKQVKKIKQGISRKKKQYVTYEKLVAGLCRKLQDSASEVLGCEKHSDILKKLVSLSDKCSVREYPTEVKQFALTLNFDSAQAYNYLRKFIYVFG